MRAVDAGWEGVVRIWVELAHVAHGASEVGRRTGRFVWASRTRPRTQHHSRASGVQFYRLSDRDGGELSIPTWPRWILAAWAVHAGGQFRLLKRTGLERASLNVPTHKSKYYNTAAVADFFTLI